MAEGQSRDDADAGHAHEPPNRFVVTRTAAHIPVKFGLLLGDALMNRQSGLNDSAKRMAGVHQFDDLLTEWRADRPRKQQAIFLEHAADLVFDIAADTDEAGASDQDRPDLLALLALHGDLTMPTDPDEFSEAPRIVFVALVDAN